MKNETKLKIGFVFSVLTSLWLTVMWNNSIMTVNQQKNTIDSLKNRSDSLKDENFILNVELGRNDLTWEYVKEKFPNVYNDAMKYKSHETE